MRLILLTVLAAGTVGLVLGGTLRDFPVVRLQHGWLAFAGVGLQLLPVSGTLGFAALIVSFLALLAFVGFNLRAPGFAVVLIGLSLNALVITVDHGMPVTSEVLVRSGQSDTLASLEKDGGAKHHLARPGENLLFLGDVIAIGAPVRQAISVGDAFVHLGVAWFIVGAMRRRILPAVAQATDP